MLLFLTSGSDSISGSDFYLCQSIKKARLSWRKQNLTLLCNLPQAYRQLFVSYA